MSSDCGDIKKKLGRQVSTADSGFSVKQSEETIRNLRKENFNLKLKMYVLENRKSSTQQPGLSEIHNEELNSLYKENNTMRNDLNEKQNLLKSALDAIQSLEYEKDKIEKKCDDLTSKQLKNLRHKKSQIKFSPMLTNSLDDNFEVLRVENKELLAKVNQLEEKICENLRSIEEFSDEKQAMQEALKLADMKLIHHKNTIANLNESLSKAANLELKNKSLKKELADMKIKCCKLENSSEETELLLNEQTGLMKALNRLIKVKNDELIECKQRLNLPQTSSSISEIFIPEDIDLGSEKVMKKSAESSDFPFYNPLFGKEYESMYR